MKALALIGVAASVAVVLAGCGSDTKTIGSSPSSSTSASAQPTTASKKPKIPQTTTAEVAGPNPTIADYIARNHIQETGIKMGDASAPAVNLPVPDGWQPLSPQEVPDYAYGAIAYTGAQFENDPPNIVALMSKLTGNVDPQKIIDLAPGEIENLPNYKAGNPGESGTLGSYPAYVLGGTYTRDGQTRVIAQKTVVIPAADGLYVLQLNVNGPEAAGDVIAEATDKIDSDTTIG